MTVPKVGDTIYVPSAWYLSHGKDDFAGGKATVTKVDASRYTDRDGEPIVYIRIKERPGTEYNWKTLEPQQEKLKVEYGDQVAHPDPDDSPESNQWD